MSQKNDAVKRLEQSVAKKQATRKHYRETFAIVMGQWKETLPETMPDMPGLKDDNAIVAELATFYKGSVKHGQIIVNRTKDLLLYGFALARSLELQDIAEDMLKAAGLGKSDISRFGTWADCPMVYVLAIARGELTRNRLTVFTNAMRQIQQRHPDVTDTAFWDWLSQLDNPEDYTTAASLRNRYLETSPVSSATKERLADEKHMAKVKTLAQQVLMGNNSLAEISDKYTKQDGTNPYASDVEKTLRKRVENLGFVVAGSKSDMSIIMTGLQSDKPDMIKNALGAAQRIIVELNEHLNAVEHEIQQQATAHLSDDDFLALARERGLEVSVAA